MRSSEDCSSDHAPGVGQTRTGTHDGASIAHAAAAPKASILIVDDKPKNLLMMGEVLAGLDEDLVQARSGREALRCLLRQDFAIVLLDVQMPDIDGYELAALIRGRERSKHVPIIFITAYDREDQDISRGYALGAVDFVFKPINPVVLRAKVSVFVNLFKMTEAIRQSAAHERRLQQENLRVRTEKIEAERALHRIEERQSLIFKSLPIALYTADLEGRFSGPRFLSDSMARAVGFKASAFVDDPELWVDRIHPADRSRVLARVPSIVETGTLSTEYRWRCADGTERTILDQAIVVGSLNGSKQELLGTCLDITYRKRLEQQLFQSQKMEALGQLTGGLAHDFNNMLTVIIWNLEPMVRAAEGSDRSRTRLQSALSAAHSCADLIRQLLTFARHQTHQAQVLDLAKLVAHAARLLRPVIGETIAIDVTIPEDIWPVYADPAQIESALLNLAINARDAMPGGGQLTVSIANVEYDGRDPELAAGHYVMLTVSDTGCGMPPELIDRVFEPFFTTKEPGKGSGLGLSMIYGFVKQSGGHVAIESVVATGTTIRLYLPRTTLSAALADGTATGAAITAAEADRTILVVEDNTSVRTLTVARLQEFGYRVIEAGNATAALDVLAGEEAVDLLFTDVIMPGGMNGVDLARRALELRPQLKVLFASGYAASYHEAGDVVGEMLEKPYRESDLHGALQRAFVEDRHAAPSQPKQSGA